MLYFQILLLYIYMRVSSASVMMKTPRPSVTFRLITVRHGETIANKDMRVQGHLDAPLNKLGMEQAKQAGLKLSQYRFSRAYCSDLQRTKSTAQQILAANIHPVPALVEDVRIKERYFGTWENLQFSEVREILAREGKELVGYTPEGAETTGDVSERMVNFFKTLCQSVYDKNKPSQSVDACEKTDEACKDDEDGQLTPSESEESLSDVKEEDISENILVTSHGFALRVFYTHIAKTLKCQFPSAVEVFPRNTAYSVFTVKYSPRSYSMRCSEYNSADHIDGIYVGSDKVDNTPAGTTE